MMFLKVKNPPASFADDPLLEKWVMSIDVRYATINEFFLIFYIKSKAVVFYINTY
jgi:hypothetical protein